MSARSIGVLVVSYRNNRELTEFLRHLDDFPSEEVSCVVATANGLNEAGSHELSSSVSALLPNRLHLIAGMQNPGYFGGAALGLRRLQSTRPTPDWIIVTNDDIRFDREFFTRLAAIAPTDIGLLAPDIVVPATGLHQNPLYASKPPARRLRLIRWLHGHPFIMRLFIALREIRQIWRQKRPAANLTAGHSIYASHGSCMIFSRQYFERGGTLDYPCFLYGEEFFVAEAVRRAGLTIRLEPSLRATHHEHSTTGLLTSASMARHVHDSLGFLLRTYYPD